MKKTIKIHSGIFQIGGSGITHTQDSSVFFIQGSDRAILINAGAGRRLEAIWQNILELGLNPGEVSHPEKFYVAIPS
jgi:hypothetical protein